MSDGAATAAGTKSGGAGAGALLAAFVAVAGLTALELALSVSGLARTARMGALVALLIAKAGVVLTIFMRAGANRRWAALTLLALVAVVVVAVVLMLDTGVRVGVR